MLDLSDIIVIACVAFSVGLLGGVWIYAGRVDQHGLDPMGEPFGDVPRSPADGNQKIRGGNNGV